jgi:hypothetical protein
VSQSLLSFVFAALTAAGLMGKPAVVQPVELMSRQEMESRVRIDAARTLQVAFEDVRVVEAAERTWPDDRLGCKTREQPAEAAPIPGFRIVVKVKAKRVTYHTDRAGRVVRCAARPFQLDGGSPLT